MNTMMEGTKLSVEGSRTRAEFSAKADFFG